jgi:Type VI secretion system (T6SS), amidase effector protein 4
MKKLPPFEDLLRGFPAVDAPSVKALVGGQIDAEYLTNMCVVRVTRALNEAGDLIGPHARGMWTLKGADKKRYGLRVKEFHKYMQETYGKPAITVKAESKGAGVSFLPFVWKRGIMMFDVRGWADATGHFDLWNGLTNVYHGYFDKASTVHLWTSDT